MPPTNGHKRVFLSILFSRGRASGSWTGIAFPQSFVRPCRGPVDQRRPDRVWRGRESRGARCHTGAGRLWSGVTFPVRECTWRLKRVQWKCSAERAAVPGLILVVGESIPGADAQWLFHAAPPGLSNRAHDRNTISRSMIRKVGSQPGVRRFWRTCRASCGRRGSSARR